jgi:hypothetical protein
MALLRGINGRHPVAHGSHFDDDVSRDLRGAVA